MQIRQLIRSLWIDPTLTKGLLNKTQKIYVVFWPKTPRLSTAARGNNAKSSRTTINRRITPKEASLQGLAIHQARNHATHKSDSSPPTVTPPLPISSPPALAGIVSHCLNNWTQLTTDPWILSTVEGYHIEWLRPPFQMYPVITQMRSPEDIQAIQTEVQSLILRQAVVAVPHCEDQFISRLFLVGKKDGSLRPVINLKSLNRFKMEGVSVIKDVLQPGDWMCSLDLKDAYLLVSITPDSSVSFGMARYTSLPASLSGYAVHHKLLRPVMAHLRSQGFRTILHLDDILLMHQLREHLLTQVEKMSQLLESLGFTVNQLKSHLTPVQEIQFLGFVVDSRLMKFFLPQEKVESIRQTSQVLLQQSPSVQQLSQILGRMVAAAPAVLSAPPSTVKRPTH